MSEGLHPTLRKPMQVYNDTVDIRTIRACLRISALVAPMAGRLADGTTIHLPHHFMAENKTPPGRG